LATKLVFRQNLGPIYSSQPDTVLSDMYGRAEFSYFFHTSEPLNEKTIHWMLLLLPKARAWLHNFLYADPSYTQVTSYSQWQTEGTGSPEFWWSEQNSRWWWLIATTDIFTLIKICITYRCKCRWQWYCRCIRQRWLM